MANYVRQRRVAAGLSQQTLADRAGVARQAVHAIETGRYLPNTLIALRLAQALACPVETLFVLPEPAARVSAEMPEEDGDAAASTQRVQVARIGARTLAYSMRGSAGTLTAADGLARWMGRDASVELLIEPRQVEQAVVVGGCDPALALLGAHLSRRDPKVRLIWRQASSRTALRSLAKGELHAAGVHMHAPERGGGNLPFVAQEVPGQPVAIIGLCDWQQGLLLAPGNPKAIRHASDLARRDICVVNREVGAGSRLLFDLWLASDAIVGSQLTGYHRELSSHLAIGEAIAAGAADAGPGILSVARALGLDFLALQEEPYDLVVPLACMRSAPMQAMLEVAVSGPYRRELAALGGYDTRRSGTIVAQLGA